MFICIRCSLYQVSIAPFVNCSRCLFAQVVCLHQVFIPSGVYLNQVFICTRCLSASGVYLNQVFICTRCIFASGVYFSPRVHCLRCLFKSGVYLYQVFIFHKVFIASGVCLNWCICTNEHLMKNKQKAEEYAL